MWKEVDNLFLQQMREISQGQGRGAQQIHALQITVEAALKPCTQISAFPTFPQNAVEC